jgi:hypothetical protein
MKKSLLSRYLLGLVVSVSATSFSLGQAEEPKPAKVSPRTRLSFAELEAPRVAQLADVAPLDADPTLTSDLTPVRAAAAARVAGPVRDVGTDVDATRKYFRGMDAIVRELRRSSTGGTTNTPGLKSVWMRKQAAKIDKLPVLGVDPVLVETGENISSSLYEAADGVTVGMGRSRVRQSAEPMHYDYYRYDDVYAYGRGYGYGRYAGLYSGFYNPGYYGRYGLGLMPYGTSTIVAVPNSYSRTRQQLMIGQEERITAVNTARNALEDAETTLASIRKALTKQYGVEF